MKRIKMLLYGDPGTGKSVFALKSPKPFFITTDGNYEWLEDFGADPNAHKQVSTWEEAKQVMAGNFDGYETIVVDLLEDLFKWCEYEFCKRNRIDHVSDIGYGKGYDITRNEYFMEICKLLAKDKHIILICHGIQFNVKDRRGVEHTKYAPSSRIPDKVIDMIEGRLRYCLRCYMKAEESADGVVLKKRYLSFVPKECEFGIARGLDESQVPHDIPLDFEEFAKYICIDKNATNETPKQEAAPNVDNIVAEEQPKRGRRGRKAEVVMDDTPMPEEPVEKPTQEQIDRAIERGSITISKDEGQKLAEESNAQKEQLPWEEPTATGDVTTLPETKVDAKQPEQPKSNADKLAAIRAKLAAMKNK